SSAQRGRTRRRDRQPRERRQYRSAAADARAPAAARALTGPGAARSFEWVDAGSPPRRSFGPAPPEPDPCPPTGARSRQSLPGGIVELLFRGPNAARPDVVERERRGILPARGGVAPAGARRPREFLAHAVAAHAPHCDLVGARPCADVGGHDMLPVGRE